MANEPVKLGTPEKHGNGIRWVKMFKRKRWVSKTVPKDTRENRREAWSSFKEWRSEVKKTSLLEEAVRKKKSKENQLKSFVDCFQDLESTKDRNQLLEAIMAYPESSMRECVGLYLDTLISYAVHLGNDEEKKRYTNLLCQLNTLSREDVYDTLVFFLTEKSQVILSERESFLKVKLAEEESDITTDILINEYVARKRSLAESNRISFGHYEQIKAALNHFCNYFGKKTLLSKLSEKTVREYYDYLISLINDHKLSQISAAQYQAVFRGWITTVCQDFPEKIKLPSNLLNRTYLIKKFRKEPIVFTKDEFNILKENSPPRLKLFLLLMLNCAMYQSDIAALNSDEIDWENGRIIRSRTKILNQSKTDSKIEPVMVNWILWRETWELFKEHSNKNGLCFLTKNGKPLISRTPKGRSDPIHSSFDRLVAKLKSKKMLPQDWKKNLKHLRKTGASILNEASEKDYYMYYSLYLGSSIAKKHYLISKNPVPTFDMAVKYIGEQFNIY